MKDKITQRLIVYFTIVLLLFSAIVGGSFLALFLKQSGQLYREDLEKRARTIADTMSSFNDNNNTSNGWNGGHGNNHSRAMGFGAYVKFIDDIAMCDVWIVDREAQTISVGMGKNEVNYSQLPPEAVNLVSKVFEGDIAFTESFSVLLGQPSVSVGAPIYSGDNIVAAVLLHTQAEGAHSSVKAGMNMLYISLIVAMILSILIAILLSKRFVRPLKRMEETTQKLAKGNYLVSTNINQHDEIGSLANHIDILAQKLDSASKESAKLEKMRKDYISNISHELRTPVTVLRGSLEALCDEVISNPDKVKEYHKELLSESIHLERMVNDLLELSRLQNSDYNIEKAKIDLPSVVSDAVRFIKHIAKEKDIEIIYESLGNKFTMQGDYGRLRQMFTIVLHNSVKFSNNGQKIWVSVKSLEKGCEVRIIDKGMGISKQELPNIFERFYKSSSAKNEKGTGLGLAIAKQIADRHDIDIKVSSNPNSRTEFLFRTPKSQD